ncbi:MAG: TlpA family protein disulfide reductase [Burkholderiales bacterium]|nr:TlpA family protein disulfide reductase [Burkholderiales bacterium]
MNPLIAIRLIVAILAFPLFAPSSGAAAENLRSFNADSFEQIRTAHAGKPFVLAFWSIYCAPCREEMGLWRALRERYPGVPIVLVSTDLPPEWPKVQRFLAQYNPGPVEHWAFADEYVERLRFSVDPKWRGELPRAYFFDARHAVQVRTGVEPQWMNDWFARQLRK